MRNKNDIKKLEGLKNPPKYVIRSLADYITHLSKVEANQYYFRGEPEYYNDIMASGLREDDVDYRRKLTFKQMIKKYYSEVGQRISDIDRRAFTAFSQHHGIPTNLIDISTSPLISLYFACQDSSESEGFVYLFNKNNTIDITERLSKYDDIHINIIDLLISNKENDIKENYEMFKELFIYNIDLFSYLFKILLYDYRYYKIDGLVDKSNKGFLIRALKGCYQRHVSLWINKEPNDEQKVNLRNIHMIQNKYYYKLIDLKNSMNIELSIDLNNENESYEEVFIYIYYLMINKFLTTIKDNGEWIAWLNFLPIFTYNPITEFQRIKNQDGLFIHQGYQISHEKVYDCSVFARQRIWPDKVFIIQNKEMIFKELKNLGINEKFIFYDFDTIANYIKKWND